MATALSHTTEDNDENLETYSLIWLDASVNNTEENVQAQKQLRTSINHLITFEDDERCLKLIQSIPKDDRIVLIVSGRLGQNILPKIVQLRQIVSIYVYCMNKTANEQWAKNFNKIKAVITELDELIHRIQTDQHQQKHNQINESLLMSVISSNDIDQGQSTTELSGDFLHSQLLIDCLIKIESTANDKNELIALCKKEYDGNSFALSRVEEFERDYSSDRVLWWYKKESFLCKMLNKALRVQNIHLLFLFLFVIRDIEQELEENKCSSPVRVYRAQLLSNDEVQMLKDSLGEFIAINSFFSTSLDRQQAQSFFSSDDNSNNVEQVFFEIDADPRLDNIKPFSDISFFSFYPDEKEVLFMIGSIFRLMHMDRDQDGILIVRMRLCSLNDHHLKSLYQHMQMKGENRESNLLTFGSLLTFMGKLNDAEKYYYRLLNELPDDHKDVARYYGGLGNVEIDENKTGPVLEKKKYCWNAIETYTKSLANLKQRLGEDHPDVAICMNKLATAYSNKQEYSEALSLHQDALTIQEKHLPANHPDLGRTHMDIAIIHQHLERYDLALSYYNSSLKIYKKSLPSQHPSIGTTLKNIGLVFEARDDFEQALSYFEKAAAILRHSLSPKHSDVIKIEKDILRVSSKLK